MRILCIEDDIQLKDMYERALYTISLHDDDIIMCETGENALNILREKYVDIIITDLMLPDMSGIDILKIAKNINDKIEVIVLTGYGSIETAVEAIRNGARDYLTKPVHLEIFVEKVNNLRDLVNRYDEIEEYRFAKEMIEGNAKDTVMQLEINLNKCLLKTKKIIKILANNKKDNEKLLEIEKILKTKKNVNI